MTPLAYGARIQAVKKILMNHAHRYLLPHNRPQLIIVSIHLDMGLLQSYLWLLTPSNSPVQGISAEIYQIIWMLVLKSFCWSTEVYKMSACLIEDVTGPSLIWHENLVHDKFPFGNFRKFQKEFQNLQILRLIWPVLDYTAGEANPVPHCFQWCNFHF